MLFKDIVQLTAPHLVAYGDIPKKVADGQASSLYKFNLWVSSYIICLFKNKFKELGLIRIINSLKETSLYLIAYGKAKIL